MTPRFRERALPAAVALGVTRVVGSRLQRGDPAALRRTNYQGAQVSLAGGPSVALGTVAGLLCTPSSARLTGARCLAVVGSAAAGWYDDLATPREPQARGLAGHAAALRAGQVSAGAVKVVVIAGVSVGAAALRTGTTGDTVLDGLLIAATANVVNLLDLRPGRAIKTAGLIVSLALPFVGASGRAVGGVVLGTLVGTAPGDLAGRSMLGDTGANAVGAAVGSVLIEGGPRFRRGCLAVIVAATLASERVSFGQVIADHPTLDRIDRWGRADA